MPWGKEVSAARAAWRAAKRAMKSVDPDFPNMFKDGLGPLLDDLDDHVKQCPGQD